MESINFKNGIRRDKIPIIVAIYHREDETRLMFQQLEKVTDNYSLILVNNGFDDRRFLKKLKPLHYVENEENTGAIHPINQGLELAEGKYVCVLHNDLLIYDEGWLDHIIEFMERRQDVGLVGFAGRHGIKEDGSLDLKTTVVQMRGYPRAFKPTWRFTEVATIDGLGWVMRNIGLRLEESYGMMHFYDYDLSLQYIEKGYKVCTAAVDIWHMAENQEQSTRSKSDYLSVVGGSDEHYFEEVREVFRAKWEHMLPIWRGERDEAFLPGLEEAYDLLEAEYKKVVMFVRELEGYVRKLENDLRQKKEAYARLDAEFGELQEYVVTVKGALEQTSAELEQIASHDRALETEIVPLRKQTNALEGRTWRAYLKLRLLPSRLRIKRTS
jgi:glycosyltransferase involved in cell wall biosynthesis